MSPAIDAVLNIIPVGLLTTLKKFVTKDALILYDLLFKISTKYTPGLLLAFMCLSFANQFVRNIEIDCTTDGVFKGTGTGSDADKSADKGLNDYCWNHHTFLVAKALQPHMRGSVMYPGISNYNKSTDEIVRQTYYKYIWLIFGILAIIAFLPYFLWKMAGTNKIEPLVMINDFENYCEESQRLDYFLETVDFNDNFSWVYVACKIFATLSPLAQLYYLCAFWGKEFLYYPIEVIRFHMGYSHPWPDPMDVLFPKIAKCDWVGFGYSGDMEVKSAQCQLPMNNITQWSFFLYWIWITILLVINILSLIYLFLHTFHILHFTRSNKIKVTLSFGDWLVLNFMKKNLDEWKFRNFIRQLATTENRVIQLTPLEPINTINGNRFRNSLITSTLKTQENTDKVTPSVEMKNLNENGADVNGDKISSVPN